MYPYKENDPCTVTSSHIPDSTEVKPFMGAKCTYIKTTKSGLALIRLDVNPKLTLSIPHDHIALYQHNND